MADTYTQLYIHIVFAVKYRDAAISEEWDERLRQYITGIVQHNRHKLIAINNMPDHMHLFIGLNPVQSISVLIQQVKGDSSEWINKEKLTKQRFRWQEGYGAFSYARSQVDTVVKYIQNQQIHHKKKNFLVEYREMLDSFGIRYDQSRVFSEME
ncbi:MAG: IS200/IS605 family transposase [Chitinophagaceae bacterium]|nr:MAG: IS200/IS605 family transposase [Chitinophagaceae bacterium]